ncbi:GAF domain-containing protein [Lentzea tibetensis]|uniref:GAF domain-containing protein n=1 Tax=Lentzea tibetensis TaxID=2591470 RepID=A0A563EYR4_9PSEU|nr:GAF domain-containing protein [Lentzea tibetensis]TWP52682.1 GAF domain-containing protein [Lentzea tibetensis]
MDYRTNSSMFSLLTEHWEEHDVLSVVVEIARKINGADRGNLQLFDRGLGGLRIAAQHGFSRPFLDFFELVADDGSACGEAMARNRVVVVPDVQRSPIFDLRAKRIMLDAGALSVQSTPAGQLERSADRGAVHALRPAVGADPWRAVPRPHARGRGRRLVHAAALITPRHR